ncbi:MAG: nucleotide exchange factor GrpE [Verrucomicrobiota bacterium]
MSNPQSTEKPETAAVSPEEQTDETLSAETAEESPLAQLQSEMERFRDLALRGQAEFENFRKRATRDKEDAIRYANMAFLERLIPILDNFELGLSAARSSAENSPILLGMDMVAKQLNDFLLQNGVEPIVAEGAKFDPNLHEAVAQEGSDSIPEGHVVRQLRRGYKLKDRLLRPSTVIVSKGSAE